MATGTIPMPADKLLKSFQLSFNPITVPANNGSANAIASNIGDIPSGYSPVALIANTTGATDVIARAFNAVTCTFYLTNVGSTAQTVTPSGIILLAKTSAL